MIIVECNTDEFLVKSLGFTKKQISHERCKGEVIKKVGKKVKAIGIIDEDPHSTQPGEMSKYSQIQKQGDVKLFIKQSDRGKQVIQISPRLEEWLLKRAKNNGINPKEYKLPDKGERLHRITHPERNPDFKKFINTLIDSDQEIKTLKKWIEEAL